MPKRRKPFSEPTILEQMVGLCVRAGHEVVPLTVRGKGAILCLECNTYLSYHAALGRNLARVAARHFSEN